MRGTSGLLIATFAIALAATPAPGQTAQQFSVQGSALYINLFGSGFSSFAESGLGGELQARYTPSQWSFGAGVQATWHGIQNRPDKASFIGAFLEPRYVFNTSSTSVFPYLSARFSIVSVGSTDEEFNLKTTATGLTANGGGGALVRLSSRSNLDLGITYGYTRFSGFNQENLISMVSVDQDIMKTGSDIVLRIGLTYGFSR